MAKWMVRLDSAHQKGPETTSSKVFNCSGDGLCGRWSLLGRNSENGKLGMFLLAEPQPLMLWPNGCCGWIQRIKKVQKPSLTKFLTVVVFVEGEVCWAEFWKSENWRCFHLQSHNHWCYDKMDGTAGFSASKRSRNTFPQSSNWSWWCVNGGEVCWGGILKIGNWGCFCLWSHNHWCYGKMDGTAGFSASKRSRNHLSRSF